MNKIVRVKNANYTTISNVFLRDKNISLKAKGFLSIVMSLPEDWDFSINGICAILPEGKTSIYSTITELKEFGYCEYNVLRDEKGRVIGNDYTFFEEPHIEQQKSDYPNSEKPNMDNQTQIKKDNKEEINKTNEKDKSFSTSTKRVFFSSSDFLDGLINAGVEESVARDWMSIRKAKKASNTATALKLVLNAFSTIKERYGISENDAITICVARGWYGCAASYFDNIKLEDYGIGTQTSLYTKNNGKEWQ